MFRLTNRVRGSGSRVPARPYEPLTIMLLSILLSIMAGKNLYLFDAEKAPIREMNSYVAAFALRSGEFPLFDCWRWDDRTMKVRDGIAKLTNSAILTPFAPSGGLTTVKGAETLSVNGVQTTFVAFRNQADTETSVWKTVDGVTFTEVTAGSGQYGNTRFTTTGDVSFCVMRHPIVYSSPDKVVFQNGADTPRVYDGSNTVKLAAITADTTMRETPVQLAPYRYFTINDPANTTYSTTGAGIAMADTGTSPDNTIRLTIQNTVTNGSTAIVTLSSATGIPDTSGRQLWLVVDSAYPVLFDRLKVEFGTSGGYVTVWDPYTATSSPPVSIAMDSTGNRRIWGFDLQGSGLSPTTSYDRIRFTWGGDANEPTATVTADILAIAISGTIEEPGQCLIGYTYMNSGSRGESPGTIFLNYEPVKIRDIGGPAQNHQRLPNDERLYFKYTIPYRNTDSTAKDAGVDLLAIYKQKPGESWPLYVGAVTLASYAGSWSFASGSASSALSSAVGTGIGDFRMPSALHLSMPIGTGMIAANGRIFVAAVGSSARAGVYISSYENNFRFLKTVDENEGESSPFSLSYPGQVVKGFASTATSTQGSSAVYTFTDKDLYLQGGYLVSELGRVSRIGPHGTYSPHTIVEHRDSVYWLDKDYQVLRMYQGQVRNLSRERVDDILKAVPANRRNSICAEVFNDRVRFGHSIASGSANVGALGFNTIRDVWEFDDTMPGACTLERMTVLGGTSPKLLGFGSDAHCYEIEQFGLTTDLGSNIATRWRTPYLHGLFTGGLLVNSVTIMGDYFSSGSWSWSFEYQPNSLTQTKAVSMDGSSGIKFAISDVFLDSGAGGGFTVQGTMTGSAPGGTSIYSVMLECEEIELVPTV